MTLLERQIINETKYNQYYEKKRIKEYFSKEDKDLLKIIEKNGIDPEKAIELVSFMFCVDHANIDMLVGHMQRFFDSVQDCCDWIDKAVDWDLVDYNGKSFTAIWTAPKKLIKELCLYGYPMPFLIEPKERKYTSDSPYQTIEKDSVFCGDTYSNDDACLDVSNKQDVIKLKLNMSIVRLTKNQWKSLVGGQKPGEDKKHYQEKIEQFNKYDREARELLEEFKDDEFYLIYNYDKRGRLYDQGYYIHSQGTDWNKACLEFAHEEIVEG